MPPPPTKRRRPRLSPAHRLLAAVALLYVLALVGSRRLLLTQGGLFTPIIRQATGTLTLSPTAALVPEVWASGGRVDDRADISAQGADISAQVAR